MFSISPPSVGKIINDDRIAKENRQNQDVDWQRNYDMQKEFAQMGVRWKVEDAKAAGLHPLYALGANTVSASPINTGSPHVPGDISGGSLSFAPTDRSQQATASEKERQEKLGNLQVERAELENAKLRSDMIRQNQVGPSFPSDSYPPIIPGQGNSYPSANSLSTARDNGMSVQRLQVTAGEGQNRPGKEAGSINDYGYVRTPTGLSIVPSKDVKERIEDQIVPESMWALRNQLLPNIGGGPQPPDSKRYPLPAGYVWRWSPRAQEFRPMVYKEVKSSGKAHRFFQKYLNAPKMHWQE